MGPGKASEPKKRVPRAHRNAVSRGTFAQCATGARFSRPPPPSGGLRKASAASGRLAAG